MTKPSKGYICTLDEGGPCNVGKCHSECKFRVSKKQGTQGMTTQNSFQQKIKQLAKSLLHWWEKSNEPRFFELELVKLSDVRRLYAEDQKERFQKIEFLESCIKALKDGIEVRNKREEERKQKLQQLKEDLPISYSWLEKFEVYDLGTKSDWKKWLISCI